MSQLNATEDQIPFLRDTICWKMGLRTLYIRDYHVVTPIATSQRILTLIGGFGCLALSLISFKPFTSLQARSKAKIRYSDVPAEEEPVPVKSTF